MIEHARRSTPSSAGKRILFWDDEPGGPLRPLLDALGGLFGVREYGQPRDHVRVDVPSEDREELSRALQPWGTMNPTGGDVLTNAFGHATCRVCGEELGSKDLFGHGFVWPEKADHYVLAHRVWTPGCDEMLAVLRQVRRGQRRDFRDSRDR